MIPFQIASNITIKNAIQRYLTHEEVQKFEKSQFKEFYERLHAKKVSNSTFLFQLEPILINPSLISFADMEIYKNLMIQYFGHEFLLQNSIQTSSKFYYNRLCK